MEHSHELADELRPKARALRDAIAFAAFEEYAGSGPDGPAAV
jgi:hypothetical protein